MAIHLLQSFRADQNKTNWNGFDTSGFIALEQLAWGKKASNCSLCRQLTLRPAEGSLQTCPNSDNLPSPSNFVPVAQCSGGEAELGRLTGGPGPRARQSGGNCQLTLQNRATSGGRWSAVSSDIAQAVKSWLAIKGQGQNIYQCFLKFAINF